MERKSIGAFIAALRKANGLTQQDVADRLNISNKAVSRWERDECMPDITLIPALAEMFGVTCDELLKGERINGEIKKEDKSEPKVDKQLKSLIRRTLSKFKTNMWISYGLALLGYICMFATSYAFYRPYLSFAISAVFWLSALVLTAISVKNMRETKLDNELFENADPGLLKKFDKTFADLSFASFVLTAAVIIISVPLILYGPYACPMFGYYLMYGGFLLVIVLALAYFLKDLYAYAVTGEKRVGQKRNYPKNLFILDAIQIFCIVFMIASYFLMMVFFDEYFYGFLGAAVDTVPLIITVVSFIAFLIFSKKQRIQILLSGLRNIALFIVSLFFCSNFGVFVIYYADENGLIEKESTFERCIDDDGITISVLCAIFIILLVECIRTFIYRKSAGSQNDTVSDGQSE